MEPMYREVSDPELCHDWLPSHAAVACKPPARTEGRPCSPRMPMGITQLLVGADSEADDGQRCGRQRRRVRKLIESRLFVVVSCSTIVLNALLITTEQAKSIRKNSVGFTATKYSFITWYTMELLLHVFGYGISCLWENSWVTFDAAILCFEFLAEVALSSLLHTGESLLLFRMLRLTPLVRTLRPIVRFRVLKVLVRSLLSSAGIMGSTCVLLGIFLYIFGILGVELVGMHDNAIGLEAEGEFRDIAHEHFSSVPAAVLTLVQFVCLDTIAAIYRPLVVQDYRLALYFVAVTLVVPILLMNLVTGVIVTSTQEHIQRNKAESLKAERSKLARQLRDIFTRLDEDQSGAITRDEILQINDEDREVLNRSTLMGDPLHIFNALDPEDTGTIGIQEFCDGVWHLATSKTAISGQQMEGQVASILRRVEGLQLNQAKVSQSLGRALVLQQGLQKSLRLQDAAWGRTCNYDVAKFRRTDLCSPRMF